MVHDTSNNHSEEGGALAGSERGRDTDLRVEIVDLVDSRLDVSRMDSIPDIDALLYRLRLRTVWDVGL